MPFGRIVALLLANAVLVILLDLGSIYKDICDNWNTNSIL
jgi:hypothetical protein